MRHAPSVLLACLALVAPQAAHGADLTGLTTVPGTIVDAAPDRVLYLQNQTSLVVRDVAAGTDTAVPVPAGRSVDDGIGRLIPGGVIFASRDGANPPGYELEQWRGGVVTPLGAFSGQLEVAGDFAVWHVSSTLVRRQVSAGTSAVVSTAAADGGDVAANGDVAFADLSGKVHRWRNGLTTLISTGASTHPANGPLTDGSEVVLNRRNPECCGAQQGVITYGSGLQETTLEGSLRDLWPEPRLDYAIDGGWVAYTRRDPIRNRMVVWTRDPDGALDGVGTDPLTPAHVRIMDVAPDGHVMYLTDTPDSVRLAATGTRTYPVSGGSGALVRAFSAAGRWYVVRDGAAADTLLRVELDTWAGPGPPAVTTQDTASFELASSARVPLIECRLDGATWQPCSAPAYSGLADGPHTFEARSTDTVTSAVETTPATVSWRIDRTPPAPFALLGPADGGRVFNGSPALEWQAATDSITAVAGYRLHVDAQVFELGPGTTTHAPGNLGMGPHTWSVEAVDEAGNVRSTQERTFTIELDAAPPEPFALVSPAAGAAVASVTPTFSWEAATDAGSGVQRYAIAVDDQFLWNLDAPAHEYTPTQPLGAGTHTWKVRAWDAQGHTRDSEARTFIVDGTAPVAVVRSVEAASTGETVHFDAGGSHDAETGIARHQWDLDGDGVFEADTGTGGHVSRSYGTPGHRVATLRVTDGAGRTATAATSVKIGLAPPTGPPGISIEAGARFTNDPQVTINVRWPLFADAVLLSNDGGFEGATEQPLAGAYTWTLDSSGSERLPKTVYARFPGAGGPNGGAITYQDDIVLDQTAPSIASATATRAGRRAFRVRLRGNDSASGIAGVQIARDRRRPGGARPFRRTLRISGKRPPRWVRATDHAGNRSGWRRVKLRR